MKLVGAGSLVVGIVDFTDHEEGQKEDAEYGQPVPNFNARQHIGCHNDAGSRAGKTFKVAVYAGNLDVEPGQAEGTECAQKGTGNESQGPQLMKLVSIHEGAGGNAEGNIIGQGVQFHPHGACGMEGSCHPAVKGIRHHGDKNKYCRRFEISLYGHHNRQPAKQCIRGGYCICNPRFVHLFQPPYDRQTTFDLIPFFHADFAVAGDVELRAGTELDHAVQFPLHQLVPQVLPGNHPSCQNAGNEDDQDGPVLTGDTDGSPFIFKAHALFVGGQEPALGIGLVLDFPGHGAAVAMHIENGEENSNLVAFLAKKGIFLHIMGHIHHRTICRRHQDIVAGDDFVISGRAAEEIGKIQAQYKGYHRQVVPFHITEHRSDKEGYRYERVALLQYNRFFQHHLLPRSFFHFLTARINRGSAIMRPIRLGCRYSR